MERRSGLGYTPIHVTAHYDRVGVARLLLEAGVNPDEEDLQVSRFLQLRPSVPSVSGYALWFARFPKKFVNS